MKTVKSIVLAGNGINCETEMAHACRLAGSDQVDIVYLYDLLSGEARLDDYHFLAFPGGFLDGDDLGSAKAMAHRLRHAAVAGSGEKLQDAIRRFIRDGKLIIGVCNGFQLLVKAGWLPALDGSYGRQEATLTFNDSGRFEDRWVYLKVNPQSPCVFTKGLEKLYFPVRHGEGKFIPQDEAVLKRILGQNLSVLQYTKEDGSTPTQEYPYNPNGSAAAIAGICDETGRVFGLMPHPEAYLYGINHPRWTREKVPEEGMGLALFRNAVEYIRKNL
jgi:phosphoribosylformylglycinamidine synthase